MVIVVVPKEHLVLSLNRQGSLGPKPLLGEIGRKPGLMQKPDFLAQIERLIGTCYPSDTYRHLAAQESTRT